MEVVKLTPKAQQQAKALLDREESSQEGLRLAVVGGGCSGLKYKLGWDSPKEADEIFSYENGLVVMVDPKSAMFLMGATLEYQDGLSGAGFEVVNPNASHSCGCGKSFS